ncbi:MAG: methylated-DNA--[protein]-cysteine S-methyltransferase [Deltaproteobacteria bacterium]|nr:methylated-DNA--[protein]-cysteine S-methyltransferase [Deltaproteobacteria bacterium]TLN03760.1 MAG: methylated-DNA--[protein]-cysteine S-methyltransferase [bacterium]
MRKNCLTITEEVHFSRYCVEGSYGVVVSTAHGLFETTLPAAASPDEILAALHKRYTRPHGDNDLTRDVAERLFRYFSGELVDFQYPMDQRRFTPFQQLVYQAVHAIGYGSVKSYGEIAREIQRPRAARGVGAAMAQNPLPIIIPCHRVIGSSGAMTGYSAPGGVGRKEMLLRMEATVLRKKLEALAEK